MLIVAGLMLIVAGLMLIVAGLMLIVDGMMLIVKRDLLSETPMPLTFPHCAFSNVSNLYIKTTFQIT